MKLEAQLVLYLLGLEASTWHSAILSTGKSPSTEPKPRSANRYTDWRSGSKNMETAGLYRPHDSQMIVNLIELLKKFKEINKGKMLMQMFMQYPWQ